MGMIRWEWEGNGNKKVIPALEFHQLPDVSQKNSEESDLY